MSQCEWQTFSGITPKIWERIKIDLANSHEIVGPIADSGSQSASGYAVTWRYIAASEVLQVQVSGPWYSPCSVINSTISDEVAKAKVASL
jgi:hypothetical protein